MKKRWISLLLTATLTSALLAGCGDAENEPANTVDDSENIVDGEYVVPEDEEITLTFLCSGVKAADGEDFRSEALPRIINEMYPNVTVEVTLLPNDQFGTTLKTKLATGDVPDLIWAQPGYSSNGVFEMAKAGHLEPITDLEAVKSMGNIASDFTWDGDVYGVASGIRFLCTFYNKDIFAEYGLQQPTNWNEFLQVCETLKSNGVQPIVMGDKDSYVMQFGLYQLAANLIYPDNPEYDQQLLDGTTHFTDKGTWDAVIDRYYELYEKGYIIDGSLGLGVAQAQQMFNDGEAAMIFEGSFNRNAVTSEGAVSFERGIFPLPGNGDGDTWISAASGAGICVSATSEYKELCKHIVELWFDGESELYQAYENCGQYIPVREGAEVDDFYNDFLEIYAAGRSSTFCNIQWFAGVETEMQAKFGEIIGQTGTTTEDMTEAMQNKYEELRSQQ